MKKSNQIFWIGIALILVLGALFFSGKIDRVRFGTSEDGTQINVESGSQETQTAQPSQAPSTKITAGNIEDTGGKVHVGPNSPNKDKGSASTPSSPAGDESISVGDIKSTKGDVHVGSN